MLGHGFAKLAEFDEGGVGVAGKEHVLQLGKFHKQRIVFGQKTKIA